MINDIVAANKEKHLQEENIDSILERATTITYDNTQNKDSLGNGFNKATFVMNDNNDVDLDDADFWSKVLPEVLSFFFLFLLVSMVFFFFLLCVERNINKWFQYKSLEYFRERMSSGAALVSDESKAQFIDELIVFVNDRKDNPPSGNLLPGM